mmetsp:Transcript_139532/g.339007  ORF Transcript_139532/g.339007 Transcript_139532/m.339007 type:complete len:356 (+) Transcript_139532:16-1083(+)
MSPPTSTCAARRLHSCTAARARDSLRRQVPLLDQRDVGAHHLLAQLLEEHLGLPAELLLRLGRVAQQQVHLCRAEVLRVDLDQLAAILVPANLVHALAGPRDGQADLAERVLHELAHGVRLAGGQHEVIRLVHLQHQPHPLDVVARVAPVALRVDVAQVQAVLQARLDARHGARDLPRHERGTAARALVVEQDAVAREHAVGLAVVNHRPVRHQLRDRVRRPRVKRRRLALRNLAHLAVELRRRCLVKLRGALLAGESHRLEEVERPDAVHLRGVHGHLERHLDVRLRREVVHLGRSHVAHDGHERVEVAQIAVVQVEVLAVRVIVVVQDVLQARVVVRRRSAFDPVHDVALREE